MNLCVLGYNLFTKCVQIERRRYCGSKGYHRNSWGIVLHFTSKCHKPLAFFPLDFDAPNL